MAAKIERARETDEEPVVGETDRRAGTEDRSPSLRTPLIVACLAAAVAIGCGGDGEDQEQQGERKTPVETVEVAAETVLETAGASGSLRSVETVELLSEATGLVEAVELEEGGTVRRGQPLVRFDDATLQRELEARRAALATAESRTELAGVTHRRVADLAERGSASAEELDRAASELEQARSEIRRLESEIGVVEERIEDTTLVAPLDGRVSERFVDRGDFVQVGDPVATLYSTDALEVALPLPERLMSRVELGQEVTVRVSAYPERRFEGEVGFISPAVNESTRTFLVKARLEDREGLLRPGAYATAEVVLERRTNRPVVPEEALVSTRTGYIVFVVEDGTARRREVEIGLRMPGRAEIVDGLEVGETVVRTGHMSLTDGMPVEVVEDLPGTEVEVGGVPQ